MTRLHDVKYKGWWLEVLPLQDYLSLTHYFHPTCGQPISYPSTLPHRLEPSSSLL